ncbi:MAG: alanine dehydrogenase [Bacteroidales bacterium]|nr:alanine dehydrogenase [Bacteroidales bacterium]MBN2763787.1 alanine dehydrogenase [Bacteroidales bacterium]
MYGGFLPQEEMLSVGTKHKKLVIGIPRENQQLEQRIPLTPEAVEVLVSDGHEVHIETKAGEGARYSDTDYSECGGLITETRQKVFSTDIILKVSPLNADEIEMLTGNQVVISSIHISHLNEEYIKGMMRKKVTAIAFDSIKDEYGCYPFVQSMSSISGISAIIMAGEYLSNHNGGKGVMLGGISGITPTEVVIIGAGTAAEYAARAALGFGAFVKVFDNSPYNLELLQQNLGRRLHTSIFHPKVLQKTLKSADVLIGTMQSPDKGPRYFISEDMVREMKKGSIIIDLTIDQGGCFETSEYRTMLDPVYTRHDVIHFCVPNMPSRVARTASIALSNILSPIMVSMAASGGLNPFIKANMGARSGIYMYNGILTNEYIGNRFGLPSKDIDLLMAAF